MPVKPIPEGLTSLTPYLIVKDAAKALDFYAETFGAVELLRIAAPNGKVAHAEFSIGNATLMLGEESAERGSLGPATLGGSAVGLMLYVEDVDAFVAKAVAAGATATAPISDQFYGDRMGGLADPFGHIWYVATHFEDVTREEMKRRADAMFQPA